MKNNPVNQTAAPEAVQGSGVRLREAIAKRRAVISDLRNTISEAGDDVEAKNWPECKDCCECAVALLNALMVIDAATVQFPEPLKEWGEGTQGGKDAA